MSKCKLPDGAYPHASMTNTCPERGKNGGCKSKKPCVMREVTKDNGGSN